MAKKKQGPRSAKNKERVEPGFRTVGIRVSADYADWLARAAEYDRVTIAAFVDRAAADRASQIGFEEAPPRRIP
jgi:uncharacterized protein (DUF1778 family)